MCPLLLRKHLSCSPILGFNKEEEGKTMWKMARVLVSKRGTPRPTVAAILNVVLSESSAGAFCLGN